VKVQVTVVITPDGHHSRVESTTLRFDGPTRDPLDVIVANAARQVARKAGLGQPTPRKEGGRG
jgi:hypothetical protein